MTEEQEIENILEELDEWILEITEIEHSTALESIGFKQLNDILLHKYYPKFLDSLKPILDQGDNELFSKYEILKKIDNVWNIDVQKYFQIVEQRLSKIPGLLTLKSWPNIYREPLLQNLILVANSIERWGQGVLKHRPGVSSNKLKISRDSISINKYLSAAVGDYNTMSRFALTSCTETEGLYYPIVKDNKVEKGTPIFSKSAYFDYDLSKGVIKPARSHSVLKLESFISLIKRGELVSYAYNRALIDLSKLINQYGFSNRKTIQKAKECVSLFTMAKVLFQNFLKDEDFNESKFIYILRQNTVELVQGPFEIILGNLSISLQLKYRIKAILNHYLVRTKMNIKERKKFLIQVLENEGIEHSKILEHINQGFESPQKFDWGKFESLVLSLSIEHKSDLNLISLLVKELIQEDVLGIYRIKYALRILVEKIPELDKYLSPIIENRKLLMEKVEKINQSSYLLAPSGANSVSYYVPDIILGNSDNIPNYDIHILNRLNVMIPKDQKIFWELDDLKTESISFKLAKHIELETNDGCIFKNAEVGQGSIPSHDISKILIKLKYLAIYVDLFESYALLARAHNGVVEKYIRRLSKKMRKNEKDVLVSKPNYGTTYIAPNSSEFTDNRSVLPTLDILTESRSNHLLKSWVKPLKILRQSSNISKAYYKLDTSDSTSIEDLFFNLNTLSNSQN